MTIVHDPGLGIESSLSDTDRGTTPFLAPELLVPSKFGLEKCISTAEADIYAMAMVVYQVRLSAIVNGYYLFLLHRFSPGRYLSAIYPGTPYR